MLSLKELNNDKTINSHYVLITDLSKLLFNQSKAGKRLHYCRRCLQHFYTQEKLKTHILQCKDIDPQKTIFPDKKIGLLNLKTIIINYLHHLWYTLILKPLIIFVLKQKKNLN